MELEISTKLEGVLMAASEPLSIFKAAQILDISTDDVEKTLAELSAFYSSTNRGFYIQQVAGGYRFATVPELADVMERFALSQSSPRLSIAALETLAIVAYRQPVSRSQIAAIRGVNSDSVLKMLIARGYVEGGRRDVGPGNAVLYSTTALFLEKLGIFSLSALPPIDGFMPGNEVAEALEASLFEEE